jgi:hypothetical protein
VADAASGRPPAASVLARTSATDVQPGSNLRSRRAGSSLLQLLPSRELGRVGLAGRSSLATVASLTDRGEVVDMQLDVGTPIDLLWLGEESGAVAPGDDRLVRLAARLAPGGRVVGEVAGLGAQRTLRRLEADLARTGLVADVAVWLRPRSGPIRTIVPVGDDASIKFMLSHGLAAPLVRVPAKHRLPILADLERRLAASRLGDRLGRRIGFIARRSADMPDGSPAAATATTATTAEDSPGHVAPPPWLVDALAQQGLAVGEHRWASAVPGEYASQKAIWYLFEPGSVEPELVVKLTRDPSFNGRLENEVAMLRRLEQVDLGREVLIPRAVALGESAGLAIAVETRVAGDPFAARARIGPADPALRSAVDWLTRLGVATRTRADSTALREALTLSVERCHGLYGFTAAEHAFLQEQVERVVDGGCPTVLIHGDPGTWNLLLTADGRLGILDWEAAEPDGLPLWDLFHLVRAYATLASSRVLPHRSLRLARRHLVAGSSLTPSFAAAVARYREALDLPAAIVEPLYHLGWVHRATKEAARLTPDGLGRGHYIRLLRAGMASDGRAGLDLLLWRGTHVGATRADSG